MKITNNSPTKYIGYAILMILLALADMGKSIGIIHTGLYVALIFARENVAIISIIYMLASLFVNMSLTSLVASLFPVVIMGVTSLILRKYKRRMSILVATIGAVVSLIPVIVYKCLVLDNLVISIIELIITAIFTYLCIVAVFAFVVKKLRFNLSSDESIAFLVMLMVTSMGIYNINIYSFRIYYVIMALGVLLTTMILEERVALLLAIAYGLGGAIIGSNLQLAGIISVMSILSFTFNRYNKYFGAVSYIALDLLFLTYFQGYETNNYLHIIASLIGAIIFLIIPNKKLVYYRNIYRNHDKGSALVAFINRNRIDVNAKISNLSSMLGDIEAELTHGQYIATDKKWKKSIASAIMCKECSNCPSRDMCFKALGGDTMSQIGILVDKAVEDKATRDDATTFLESRCSRIDNMVGLANDYAKRYAKMSIHISNVIDNASILGNEIGSIGKLLDKLSSGILEGISESSELEERIIEEMNIMGIVCHDVLVIEKANGGIEITLVVRNGDKNKRCIRRILEKLTRLHLDKLEDRTCELEGFATIRFMPRPKYILSYGIASINKDGSPASGDTKSAIRLDRARVALTLCDGKGSGQLANINSNNTINIIEKLYKAGFDSSDILSFTNRILSIRNSEDFSALDMCVVDLDTAGIDFIKFGGVASFIKRSSTIDIIEGSSLPIGVLEEATPSTIRRLASKGDIIVMVSDGVTDSLGIDGVKNILLNMSTDNVQTISDELLTKATENGAMDDTTIMAFRLSKA